MGAACNISQKDGVLLLATRANMPRTVAAALEEGANPNARGCDNWPAVMLAAWFGYVDILKILVGAGADINATGGNKGGTVLLIAAQRGFVEMVEFALQNGARKDVTDADGDTTKSAAEKMGHECVVKLLEKYEEQ